MKKTNLLVGFVLLLQIVTAQIQPTIYREANKEEMNAWVDSVYSSLTIDERIGQLFMIVANTHNTNANKNLITKKQNWIEAKVKDYLTKFAADVNSVAAIHVQFVRELAKIKEEYDIFLAYILI